MFKVNIKDARTTSKTSIWYLYCETLNIFRTFFSLFIVDFEQVNFYRVVISVNYVGLGKSKVAQNVSIF